MNIHILKLSPSTDRDTYLHFVFQHNMHVFIVSLNFSKTAWGQFQVSENAQPVIDLKRWLYSVKVYNERMKV